MIEKLILAIAINMGKQTQAKFQNDQGVTQIFIGVKQFECIGASPPYDHPHIYLNMGKEQHIRCPYCSTLYTYDETLSANTTQPEGCSINL